MKHVSGNKRKRLHHGKIPESTCLSKKNMIRGMASINVTSEPKAV